MGTRSSISVLQKDGSIREVYCHYDGYITNYGVGERLLKFFNSEELANDLLDKAAQFVGSGIRSLGENSLPCGETNVNGTEYLNSTSSYPTIRKFKNMKELEKSLENG
jgi:hypothetical protein